MHRPAIEAGELKQPPNPHLGLKYDATKTYITFIVGDGDNLEILRGRNLSWLLGRQRRCESSTCFPLVWSFSPQAIRVMPEFARHAYGVAAATGSDFFNLPGEHSMSQLRLKRGLEKWRHKRVSNAMNTTSHMIRYTCCSLGRHVLVPFHHGRPEQV